MDRPTTILSNEHKYILKAIEAIEKKCNKLEVTGVLDKEFFEKAVDFIRNYADRFHHAKEEKILFVEFCKCSEQSGFHCDPTEQMLYEHERGRECVSGILDGLAQDDNKKIIESCRNYAHLLKEHISKEDGILYPMINQVIGQEIQESILNQFNEADKKMGDQKKYLLMFENYE